jgi:acyl-CoA synthetase (AMP-forming)/AMP-acid ligase II
VILDTVPWGTDLAAAVAEFGDTEAVWDGARGITLAALASRAASLALLLRARGLESGIPVAICLRNFIAAVWVGMALRLAGVAETTLSPSYTEAERRYCLDLAGARLVVTTAAEAAGFAPWVEAV